MMKKIILLSLIVGVLFAAAATMSEAQYRRDAYIVNASLVNQEPDPVGPGDIVELRFRIENRGGILAKDVRVELLPEYPFLLRPGDSAVKEVGTLESQQKGNDGAIVKYKIIVDKGAPDGEHEIRVRYRTAEDNDWVVMEPFLVKVQSHIAILSITKVFSVPMSIAPGDKAKVSIELRNYASSFLKDILVKLDLSGTSLNPSGSSNEKVVSSIGPQESGKADFELIANPDAAAGIVRVPVSISYSDVTGKNYSKSNTISLIVGDAPDISITLDKSDIYTKGSVGSVVIRVVNKGTTDVKFMNAKLGNLEQAQVIGSDEVYIGNLDSDDFSTAEFNLYIKDAKGEVVLPVTVEYKDANNNNYRKESALALRLYSAGEAKKISNKGNGSYVWVIIVAVVVIGIFAYRRWKKRKTSH